MNGTTHPLLSLLDHFSSPLAGGGLFIQQSTKSQLPPPNLFHMPLSLSSSHTLSRPLSLSTPRNRGQIFGAVQYLSSLLCPLPTCLHTRTSTHTRKKKPSSTSPVLLEECSPPRHSLSPSLGQNNNERPGPHLNRSRRIMT